MGLMVTVSPSTTTSELLTAMTISAWVVSVSLTMRMEPVPLLSVSPNCMTKSLLGAANLGEIGVVLSTVGAAVSRLSLTLALVLVLPAASVWRTCTVWLPSPSSKLLSVPSFQLWPLSRLYCQVVSVSKPLTLAVAMLLRRSWVLLPLSVASARVRSEGAVVSTVMAWALLPTKLSLPARSVWRTFTWPAA